MILFRINKACKQKIQHNGGNFNDNFPNKKQMFHTTYMYTSWW